MSDNQAGTGSPSPGRADTPWQPSSLADSSLDDSTQKPTAGPSPSPFSREGSDPSAALGSDAPPAGEQPPAPPTPPAPEARYGAPTPYPSGQSSAPGFDPQPTAPYGTADPQGYGQPSAAPFAEQPAYGSANPYESTPTPYQPSYGGYTPYGLVPVNHPQATQSLIFGILGLVLGLSCGVGALFGIAGIVTGRKVRQAIDADPQRYTGRGMASAAIGLGIGGLVVLALWIVLVALGLAFGS